MYSKMEKYIDDNSLLMDVTGNRIINKWRASKPLISGALCFVGKCNLDKILEKLNDEKWKYIDVFSNVLY